MANSAVTLNRGLEKSPKTFRAKTNVVGGIVETKVVAEQTNSEIMPRKSRENTVEEKRRMRNERNRRKRLLRASEKMKAGEIRRQQERAAYTRAKGLARIYYKKWRQLSGYEKSSTLHKTKVSFL